jgi:hypothetical protein
MQNLDLPESKGNIHISWHLKIYCFIFDNNRTHTDENLTDSDDENQTRNMER